MKLVSIKNSLLTVEDPSTGAHELVLIEFEADGTLVIADAGADVPRFVKRVKLDAFPTDEAVHRHIEAALGGPRRVLEASDRCLELDSSVLSGLRKMPVDIFDNVYLGEVKESALVLCVDIRNFSNFLCQNNENDVFKLIKDFTSNFLSCVNQFGFGCSYYKLMGDGAIVIWDETTPESVSDALQVFDTYIDFVNEELFSAYDGLGLAGALVMEKVFKYEISAEASQLKYRDYVGYGINLSCRLQALARKDHLVVNHTLARTGLVPDAVATTPEAQLELKLLKGLKDEDRGEILLYAPK